MCWYVRFKILGVEDSVLFLVEFFGYSDFCLDFLFEDMDFYWCLYFDVGRISVNIVLVFLVLGLNVIVLFRVINF